MNKQERLNISSASKLLGVSIGTLRRWDKKGKLKAQKSEGGHRYYSRFDLELFKENIFAIAKDWVFSSPKEPDKSFYCQTSIDFKGRLSRLENNIAKLERMKDVFPLITAIVGELGNNSFDHNLGNWTDIPGLFFGYNLDKGMVVLADRGQGVLNTLRKVRPSIKDNKEALQTAFTEILSSRAPEARGNGLKFVRSILESNPFELDFYSGNAVVIIKNKKMDIIDNDIYFDGCLILLKF